MSSPRQALLVTADGETFRGVAAGVGGVTIGEAVFNTSMTGYQEVITDPSYAGQVVVMTSPHIGNYGVNREDAQSGQAAASGFVMRSLARRHSSWRSEGAFADYLVDNGVVAISEVDTRRLTRHLRDRGAMPVAMGTDVDERELASMAAAAPTMEGQDLASLVSTSETYFVEAKGIKRGRVVAIDLGIKRDILANLAKRGLEVVVVPLTETADSILAMGPDGVFLSNGPGDPEPLATTTATLRGLLGRTPVFGICLGHQVLGLAVGARTFKLPFGHHGGNHPVLRMEEGRVEVTAQNHGFAVDLWSLTGSEAPKRQGLPGVGLLPDRVEGDFGYITPTHQNLNDGTLEGMRLEEVPAFSVQYHPEASPGPQDAQGLFDDFVKLIEAGA